MILVTISGIGGSGKSTCAKQIVDLLVLNGMKPLPQRFQRMKCFLFLQKAFYFNMLKGNVSNHSLKKSPDKNDHINAKNYKYRTLNLVFTLGYILRILMFRVYCLIFIRNELVVLDRYFYDNLAQFHIKKKSERIFFSLIKKIIPTPDLALILHANNDIIKVRRPHRSLQHIASLNKYYHELCQKFNNLTVVHSDDIGQMKEDARNLIQQFLIRKRNSP